MDKDFNDEQKTIKRDVKRRVAMIIIQLLFGLSLLFGISGDITYIGAWLLGGLYIICYIFYGLFLPKKVIIARLTKVTHQPTYEKVLQIPMLLFGYGTYVVAALDKRMNWTMEIPWYMLILASVIFLMGMGIVLWSMSENPYFNQKVSTEEKHEVIVTGPYAVIRHPGYLGMMTYLTVVPLILESLFAMIPTVCLIICFIIRTNLEDKYLKDHLEGYQDYQKQVKKRLFRTYKS